MKAITTKYHPCGNVLGARISACDVDGHHIYIDYPQELSGAAVHAEAALALCRKMGWEGDLISGGTADGYGYVFVFAESFEALVLPRRVMRPFRLAAADVVDTPHAAQNERHSS